MDLLAFNNTAKLDEVWKTDVRNAIKRFLIVQAATFEVIDKYVYIH